MGYENGLLFCRSDDGSNRECKSTPILYVFVFVFLCIKEFLLDIAASLKVVLSPNFHSFSVGIGITIPGPTAYELTVSAISSNVVARWKG